MKKKTLIAVLVLLVMIPVFAFSAEAQLQHSTFKVAGVTFNNDDSSSRQWILQSAMEEYGEWERCPGSLKEYVYDNKPAIYVMLDERIIGNIPAEDVGVVLTLMDDLEDCDVMVSSFEPNGETIYFARVTLYY